MKAKATAKAPEVKRGNPVPKKQSTDFSQPTSSPIDHILFLQKTIGNQAVLRLLRSGGLQAKSMTMHDADRYEREADWIADQIVTARSPVESGKCTACHEGQVEMQHKPLAANITQLLQTKTEGEQLTLSGSLQGQIKSSQGGGQPLPISTRRFMESRFGADFSSVRVHTSNDAAGMNSELNAHGFTIGQDIYFGAGRFRPESIKGRKLLAHELAHTLQQTSARNSQYLRSQPSVIQREAASQGMPRITARTIFPYPQGSRVVLNRIMPDNWLGMLSGFQPQFGAALRAIENRVATVTTTSDDLFEAAISGSVSLPAQGSSPAMTLRDVTLRLRRQPQGTFNLVLAGRTDAQSPPTTLFQHLDLTARREGGGIVLSSGGESQLRVSSGGGAEQTRIEAFTAPYLSEVPEDLRNLVPERLDLIQLTRLPDVRSGTAEERTAVRAIASRAREQRRWRRQRLLAGGGMLVGDQVDPLLTASWQINFTPISRAGTLFQIPLEVQLQYAPTSSVLAAVSSGVETSLSQLSIPVNVRLVTGLAGGTIQRAAPEGSEDRPVRPAFGPTLGAGVGLELRSFRIDLRYEHFFNLLRNSPNADAVFLRLGGAY